ncbi:MAG: HAD family hydrolase [Acidimicrobiales bacterium]
MGLLIGIDADDTLWHNEKLFSMTEQRFVELVAPWAHGVDVASQLLATERRNLASLGYGVKSFVLSMIETAIEVTDGTIPATVISTLLEAGRSMMDHPVELLDGAEEVVAALALRWPLVLVTKGDLFHQESKIARSGLAAFFTRVEIVSEKDIETYERVIERAGATPADFVMIGDSVRSDIAPVLALGGRAVHIPGFREWELERADIDDKADGRWWKFESLRAVSDLVTELDRSRLDAY